MSAPEPHEEIEPDPLARIAVTLNEALPPAEAEAVFVRIRADLAGAIPPTSWEELAAENARLQHELERQSETDPLTGVRNRRRFFEDLGRELAEARRHEDVLSVLVVHLDGLAGVNQEHGLEVGDGMLVALAETLLRTVRVTDIVGRLGDDDFGLILPRTDAAGAALVAERLADASEARLRVGIAELCDDVGSSRDLFEHAFATLADRRRAGRRAPAA